MNFPKHVLSAAIALLAGAVACTTTQVTSKNPTDSAAAPEDDAATSDPPEEDAGGPATATAKPGQACTATKGCDATGVCTVLPGASVGVCGKKCEYNSDCGDSDDDSCAKVGKEKACISTCVFSGACEHGLKCSSIGGCEPDCKAHPGVCGSQFDCRPDGSCGQVTDTDPDPVCTLTAQSGVTAAKSAGSLTMAEKGTFCDWQACQFGGYGTKAKCDGGISTNAAASKSACVGKFPAAGCAATVSEMEACVKAQAKDRCSLVILNAPECASLRACL